MNWFFISIILCCKTSCSCISDNADAWIALTGIVLSFISVFLSFVGLRQIGKARKEIAYSQVKIQQTEIMNKLLLHLNRLTLHTHLCSFDEKSEVVSQEYYECNIFELKAILNANSVEYEESDVLFLWYSNSLLYLDEYFTNGFLDKDVANALILFDPRTSNNKIEMSSISDVNVILVEGERTGTTQNFELYKLENSNVNKVKNFIASIDVLETAIKNWDNQNGIKDCNILINPNNLKPQIEKNKKGSRMGEKQKTRIRKVKQVWSMGQYLIDNVEQSKINNYR